MSYSIYEFKESDVFAFANAVRAKTRRVGNELTFRYCPYCMGGEHNDKETFSISLTTGQFECKRSYCGVRGNMITLAKDFANDFQLSKDVQVYYNINNARNQYKKFRDAHRPIEVRDPAITYLQSRGIPEDIVRKYEITTKPDQDNVLVFPFRDENGDVVYVKYRDTAFVKGESTGNKEWVEKGGYKPILFGMYQCEDFETLVITEGQIDALSCAAAGIKNAVSVPGGKKGFTWKPHVWNWLVRFNEIVVFGDNENGEITLAKEITTFFPKKVRVVKPESYQGNKDANEMLQRCGAESLRKAVKEAEAQISLRIKNLADVEDVDIDAMTAYPTGFSSLDKAIGRGFHDGELIILTGKCGEGKSTFASQIVAKMIKNGLKVFCYSGELPNFVFKAWIDKQICNGRTREADRNAASAFYDKKCYIYDNSSVIDENEEIFCLIKEAVISAGCNFILIDNLMTAMEDNPSEDLFRQQSTFVTKLTKLAKGYNIIIVLVAHPKKGNSNSNDAISGSGDITNRANLVLRFQRKKDGSNNQSLIMITKNRTTGILNNDGIEVEYHPESMRICEIGMTTEPFLEDDSGFDDIAEDDLESIPF